jgi:RimJ/RimL family protein N-acetyltransferase
VAAAASWEDGKVVEERIELVRGRYALLRATEAGDAESIVQWRNQPETARWLNQLEPLTVDAHLRWYDAARRRGDLLLFFEGLDGEPVAACSVFDFNHPGTTAEWGRLFSSGGGGKRTLEACYLLHRMCFDALGFFRLYGHVWTDNERAWRLYQFLGWVKEGVRRQHDWTPEGYHDVYEVACFHDEFDAQRRVLETRLYGESPPPQITDAEARRLRQVVGALIHRDLEAAWGTRPPSPQGRP